jgi:hypothetical protein
LADHAQELQQARKLPLAPKARPLDLCAWDADTRYSLAENRRSPSIPNPPPQHPAAVCGIHRVIPIHHSDHCLPCATALQICLPPALMSAASQRRRAPLLSCYRTPAVRWEACSSRVSLLGSPSGRARAWSADCWLLTDCVEEYASLAKGRHFSIAAAPTRTSYSSVEVVT